MLLLGIQKPRILSETLFSLLHRLRGMFHLDVTLMQAPTLTSNNLTTYFERMMSNQYKPMEANEVV